MAQSPQTRLTESASSREVSRKKQAVSPPEWAQECVRSLCVFVWHSQMTNADQLCGSGGRTHWVSPGGESGQLGPRLQRRPKVVFLGGGGGGHRRPHCHREGLRGWRKKKRVEGGSCCVVSPAWCIYLQGGSRRGVGCDGASTGSVARSPRDAEAAVAGLIVIPLENCKMSPIVLANPLHYTTINVLRPVKNWKRVQNIMY